MSRKQNWSRWRTFLAVGGLVATASAQSPTFDEDLWVTDGEVLAVYETGSHVYLGGDFSYVGPPTGAIGLVTGANTNDSPDTTFPKVGSSDGVAEILAVAEDGSGGYFVGGEFDSIGGESISNLAHIDSNGNVTAGWTPNPNGAVHALLRDGTDLYVGGAFTIIDDDGFAATRNRLMRLGTSTASVVLHTWNPDVSVGNSVNALARNGTDLYVCGSFATIGGVNRGNIAEVDTVSAAISGDSWDTDGDIFGIVLQGNNPNLFIVGDFTQIRNQNVRRIGKLGPDGEIRSWRANANDTARSIVLHGDNVFVGGDFDTVEGSTRRAIVKISTGSGGNVKSWNAGARIGFGVGSVRALAVDATNNRLYVGGNFDDLGGEEILNIGRVGLSNATDDGDTGWTPNAASTVEVIFRDDTDLVIGGIFGSIGGEFEGNLVRLSRSTGELDTTWLPRPSDAVHAIAIDTVSHGTESYLVVGGEFEAIFGALRGRLAQISVDSSTVLNWDPEVNGIVRAVAVGGSNIYFGGQFTIVKGVTRNRLASMSANTATTSAWNPNPNNTVWAIATNGSSNIYVGGDFTHVGSMSRNRIAKLNSTGTAMPWNAHLSGGAGATVRTISRYATGGTIFVGGLFSSVGSPGVSRRNIAELIDGTAVPTSWIAGNSTAIGTTGTNNTVHVVRVVGSSVYLGGTFSSIGNGVTRQRLARCALSNGAVESWNPELDANPAGAAVRALDASSTTVTVGGSFRTRGDGVPTNGVADISR